MTQQERIQYNSYPTSDFGLLTSGMVCPLTLIQAIQVRRFGIPVAGVRLYFKLYCLLSIALTCSFIQSITGIYTTNYVCAVCTKLT